MNKNVLSTVSLLRCHIDRREISFSFTPLLRFFAITTQSRRRESNPVFFTPYHSWIPIGACPRMFLSGVGMTREEKLSLSSPQGLAFFEKSTDALSGVICEEVTYHDFIADIIRIRVAQIHLCIKSSLADLQS